MDNIKKRLKRLAELGEGAEPSDDEFWDSFWQSNAFNVLVPPEDDMVYANRFGLVVMSVNTYQKLRDGEYDYCSKAETPTNTPTDLISRQAAIDAVEKAVFKGVAKSAIKSLPPVEPERKNGEWLTMPADDFVRCDKCGFDSDGKTNFCPNCGADMRGDKDEQIPTRR